jgi:hypothetical protein
MFLKRILLVKIADHALPYLQVSSSEPGGASTVTPFREHPKGLSSDHAPSSGLAYAEKPGSERVLCFRGLATSTTFSTSLIHAIL